MRRLRGWLLAATAAFTLQLLVAVFMAAQDVWHCRQSPTGAGAVIAAAACEYARGARSAAQLTEFAADLQRARAHIAAASRPLRRVTQRVSAAVRFAEALGTHTAGARVSHGRLGRGTVERVDEAVTRRGARRCANACE
jgi:hypothetical protein